MSTQIPIVITLSLFTFLLSILGFICQIENSLLILSITFTLLGISVALWIIRIGIEYIYKPYLIHESFFIKGFYLFLITEILFFSSFFWAYYSLSIDATCYIGGVWPPQCLIVNFPSHITNQTIWMNVILLSSSLLIAINGHLYNSPDSTEIKDAKKLEYNKYLKFIIILVVSVLSGGGVFFLEFHREDLIANKLAINSSVFGSIYHAITGLHSMHVFIGIFLVLVVSFFTATVLSVALFYYWHLIDLIWLFVLSTQYIHYSTDKLALSTFIMVGRTLPHYMHDIFIFDSSAIRLL